MTTHKAILFSAPSGSGKTTIIRHLLTGFPQFEFAISATSRPARGNEQNGVDYYFMSHEQFLSQAKQGAFIEWEEVYEGTCYGTPRSEIDRIWSKGNTIIFDVDVNGGMNLKKYFGNDALAIFVMPPSIEVLEQRLRTRGTDSEESIIKRLKRSALEMDKAPLFDLTIINDNLQEAVSQAEAAIKQYLQIK